MRRRREDDNKRVNNILASVNIVTRDDSITLDDITRRYDFVDYHCARVIGRVLTVVGGLQKRWSDEEGWFCIS